MHFLSKLFSNPFSRLQPKPIGMIKIITNSVELFFSSFSTLFMYTGLYLITLLAGHFVLLSVGNNIGAYYDGALNPNATYYISIQAIMLVTFLLIKSLLFVACYIRLNDYIHKRDSNFVESIKTAFQKIIPFLCVNIITFIVIALSVSLFFVPIYYLITENQLEHVHVGFVLAGFLICLVPSVIFTYYLIFAHLLILIDQEGILGSCIMSYRLVKNHWWRTCVLLDIPAMLIVGFTIIPVIVTLCYYNDPDFQSNSTLFLLLFYILQAATITLSQSFVMTCLSDLKVRQGMN